MIDPQFVDFFEYTIQEWTPKQKMIAYDLIVDQTYQIIKVYVNKQPTLSLRNNQNGSVVELYKHVKSKCNC
jgi:hypothetical protein